MADRLQSKTQRDILKDRGAPKGGLGDCELASGNPLDRVDRSDWPDEVVLEAPQAETEAVAKSGNRRNPAKQPGTTGGEGCRKSTTDAAKLYPALPSCANPSA